MLGSLSLAAHVGVERVKLEGSLAVRLLFIPLLCCSIWSSRILIVFAPLPQQRGLRASTVALPTPLKHCIFFYKTCTVLLLSPTAHSPPPHPTANRRKARGGADGRCPSLLLRPVRTPCLCDSGTFLAMVCRVQSPTWYWVVTFHVPRNVVRFFPLKLPRHVSVV